MSGIFISYRREDAGGSAGRIYDRLSMRFGKENVFMDVDAIEPGEDFIEAIEKRVGSCDALIAVIGPKWLNCQDEGGHRRLDDPNDFVRIEVASALKRGVRVVPALVDGAHFPRAEDLPEALAPLTRRNALEITSTAFHPGVDRLIEALEKIVAAPGATQQDRPKPSGPAKTPALATSKTALPKARILGIAGAGVALVVFALLALWIAGRNKAEPPQRVNSTNAPLQTPSGPGHELSNSNAPPTQFSRSPRPEVGAQQPPATGKVSKEQGARSGLPAETNPNPRRAQAMPQQAAPSVANPAGQSVALQEWNQAWAFYQAKDYEQALPLLKKCGAAGNFDCLETLAYLSDNGLGVNTSHLEALQWYRQAAELGDPRAMKELIFRYEHGFFEIQADTAQAQHWKAKLALLQFSTPPKP